MGGSPAIHEEWQAMNDGAAPEGAEPWAMLQGLGNTAVFHALLDASLGGHRSEWVPFSPGYAAGSPGESLQAVAAPQ